MDLKDCPNLTIVHITGKPRPAPNVEGLAPFELADVVRKDWRLPYFGAKPYLDAMGCLHSWKDDYVADSGKSIGLYFLSNATTWKGDTARAVKKEMRKQLGLK